MVITYCDVPLTWEGNVLKIPCSPADAMTDAQVASLVSYREMTAESRSIRTAAQVALKDTATVLRALIGSGGGEGGPEVDPVYSAAAAGLVQRSDSTLFSHGFVTPRQLRDTLLFLWAQIGNLKNTDIQLRDSLRKHTVRINQLADSVAKLRHQIEILGDSITAHRTVLNGLGGGGAPPTNGLASWAATYELDPGGVNISWISAEPQAVIATYIGNADEPPGQPVRWEYEPGGGVWVYGEEGRFVSVVIYYWSY
jgi:hypothetical protein